ncbi:hypothetical protein [Gordonia phthalatica]|uniref:Uncharacterized protein n=1 Tax=Gordonia phthalatica TaxID=1136941 RepID=A0A0N9NHJ5_9ACTN|nr:hypothetical protein [Gordonia phthalatica]ALG85261.1 hypothetical protein ACH46_13220 [Gordonia phthalatica]
MADHSDYRIERSSKARRRRYTTEDAITDAVPFGSWRELVDGVEAVTWPRNDHRPDLRLEFFVDHRDDPLEIFVQPVGGDFRKRDRRVSWADVAADTVPSDYSPAAVAALTALMAVLGGPDAIRRDGTLPLHDAGPALWPALDAVDEAGVRVWSGARQSFGFVSLVRGATIVHTVENIGDDGVLVSAAVQLSGRATGGPVRIIGSGAVFFGENEGLYLSRLDRGITPLEKALIESERCLHVPADQAHTVERDLPSHAFRRGLDVGEYGPIGERSPAAVLGVDVNDDGALLRWRLRYRDVHSTWLLEPDATADPSTMRDAKAEEALWIRVRPHLESVAGALPSWQTTVLGLINYESSRVGDDRLRILNSMRARASGQTKDQSLRKVPVEFLTLDVPITSEELAMLRDTVLPQISESDDVEVIITGEEPRPALRLV